MASRANSIREFGQVGDIFEITNDAQKGGSFASIFVPLGTLVKAPAAAAKGMRAAKTVDAVADTTKTADTVSDVAKAPEPKGPNGNGTGEDQAKNQITSPTILGKNAWKKSKTGREVQDRMREEGKLRENIDTGRTEFQASDGRWYDISKADMSHNPKDAVTWWNETGRQYGAKSPEVRAWMRDSKNYTLDHYSLNRSAGAKLTETYLPPLK